MLTLKKKKMDALACNSINIWTNWRECQRLSSHFLPGCSHLIDHTNYISSRYTHWSEVVNAKIKELCHHNWLDFRNRRERLLQIMILYSEYTIPLRQKTRKPICTFFRTHLNTSFQTWIRKLMTISRSQTVPAYLFCDPVCQRIFLGEHVLESQWQCLSLAHSTWLLS